MVSKDIGIKMSLDDSEPLNKFSALEARADKIDDRESELKREMTNNLNALEERADEIAAKELQLRREIARTAQKAAMLAMASIAFLRSVYSIAGIQLSALQEAILMSIQQVVNTAVAWFTLQAAITAGSFGIAAVGMIAAAAALGVAVGNAAMIAVYGEQVDQKMNAMIGAIVNLESIAVSFSALSGDI